jgi:O-antigen/teichoic acid export membrane protein
VLWLLTLPLGPLLAWLYAGEPGAATLHWLVPTVGTTVLIAGLHSTAVYRLNRHLHLRPVVLLDLGAQIAGCTVGLACAWFHPGIAALVAGVLVHQVVYTAGSHLLGTRNRFRWDREAAAAVIRFGRWIWLSTMLTWVAMQTDRLVMPKLLGFDGLAVYQVALMIASAVPEAVHMVGSKVLFPALSDFVRRRDPALNARLQKARAAIVLPAVGALLTLSLFGEPLVHLLYPRAFRDSGWMLRLLAAAAIPQALTASSWYAFFAIGRAKVPTLLQAAKVVVKVGAMVLGFRLDGARGVILGLVVAELLHYPFVACALRRHGLLNLRFDALVLAASALSVATGLWLW